MHGLGLRYPRCQAPHLTERTAAFYGTVFESELFSMI